MQTRVGQAFYLVDIIGGDQFTAAGRAEISQAVDVLEVRCIEGVITIVAIRVTCKCRMRLIADTRLDVDIVDAVGNVLRRRVRFNRPALRIEIVRFRHPGGRQWNQFVGAFQVVILQRGFVDLRGKGHLVGTVGLHRIKVVGALLERGIEYVLARLCGGIRPVPGLVTAGANAQ